jgi:RNA recognition motif-containing protein
VRNVSFLTISLDVLFFNLPIEVTEEEMKNFLSNHGKINKFRLFLDKGVCFIYLKS